jgi:hypothetical protein
MKDSFKISITNTGGSIKLHQRDHKERECDGEISVTPFIL